MGTNKSSPDEEIHIGNPKSGTEAEPEWATGLRRLYDSVVEEPLPDSFADLLAKLDKTDK